MNLIRKLNIEFVSKKNLNLGNTFFLVGIFFLPSAIPIGALLLLISIIISITKNYSELLKNKFNISFLICSTIIIVGTFYNTFLNPSGEFLTSQKSVIWLNLFNWIPIYFTFLGFQIYLKNEHQRLLFQKFLIAGTIPVLASCIMHRFLNIYGPLETLYGTIVWFNYASLLYPLGVGKSGFLAGGVSGLFNNPNYLGMWLSLCLPFSLSLLRIEKINLYKIILSVINFLIITFIVLANSRNAFLGLLICFLLFFGIRRFIYFSFFIGFGIFIFNIFIPNFLNLDQSYLFYKFSNFSFDYNSPRIIIWSKAIFLISQKPWLGWGSGSLPFVNMFIPPFINYQHNHNMIFELAYNFGIPLSILVFSTVINIVKSAYLKINRLNKSFLKDSTYKSFVIAVIIFLISHLNDITYYDGKISILFSALLACLIKIIDEKNLLNEQNKINTIKIF